MLTMTFSLCSRLLYRMTYHLLCRHNVIHTDVIKGRLLAPVQIAPKKRHWAILEMQLSKKASLTTE